MAKEICVVIVEDDPYARDLMSMLLTRDWRTRVMGEFGSNAADLTKYLSEPVHHVDVIIVDTETPEDPRWPAQAARIAQEMAHPPVMLYTCTVPDNNQLERLPSKGFGGYLVKSEILYALATAVSLAAAGQVVITPKVRELHNRQIIPDETVVLDGRRPVARFTRREKDLARLGVLFNLAQRDVADELVVSTDFISEVMSQVYDKLGVHEILSGESPLEDFFEDEAVLARCKAVLSRSGNPNEGKAIRKAPWMATIAFHLLTVPEKVED